jgi:hypothetical protein
MVTDNERTENGNQTSIQLQCMDNQWKNVEQTWNNKRMLTISTEPARN